jgi:hypothetical protein
MQRRTKLGAGGLLAAGAIGLAAIPVLGAPGAPPHAVRPIAASPTLEQPLRSAAYRVAVAQARAGYAAVVLHMQELAALAQAQAEAAAAAARRGGGGGARCQDGPLEYGSGSYSIPSEIVQRESGGWYYSCNESSGACGAYQVLPSTWDGYGGYGSACDAPPEVQDQWAAEAWAESGAEPWGG